MAISFEHLEHSDPIVDYIFNHPRIIKGVTDSLPDFVGEVSDKTTLVGVMYGGMVCGIISIEPMNTITYQLHIALLPALWGRSTEVCSGFVDYIFTRATVLKLVAIVPTCNPLVLKMLRRMGINEEGVITKSFLRNWKRYDMIIFGLTKEEWLCRKQ